ncbi:MAG: methyltransferase domain-containing protein [Chloroflexi bacterium]|nr:methyltransferase domain-containing protein [Chloroflexota bacterium]
MTEHNVRSVFDRLVERYDAWYDSEIGRAALAEELDALRPLVAGLPHPWLEVGVGTGRIAAGLGVELGLDPASDALVLAQRRGISVVAGVGGALPFRDGAVGLVLFVTTLCFVADPLNVLREAARVLGPGGAIVLGIIPADGPWGRHYRQLAAEGHAYYREAHFFTRPELAALLSQAGLRLTRARSALRWSPTEPPSTELAREGDDDMAGFLAVLARRSYPER